MEAADNTGYKVWAVDGMVYGPVELPELISWIKDERVLVTTWIFSEKEDAWKKAGQVSELKMFFKPLPNTIVASSSKDLSIPTAAGLKLDSLRRVKILADLSDSQLDRFVRYMEVLRVRQWTEIVRQGDHGDAMYLILEGELRVRLIIGGKETTLTTLNAGEFFGEISLFDHGPRSADVVANTDSVLLIISAPGFNNMIAKAPELAAAFLYAIGKTLTARIRADNKRYRDSITFARIVSAEAPR